jgi:uncharacterized protein
MTKSNDDILNKKLCESCTLCCEYVTIEIEEPKKKEDVDHIMWYILHGAVIYIDENNEWLVEIKKRCEALNDKGECDVYNERPDICRDYSHKVCEKYSHANDHFTKIIKNREEFMEYILKSPVLRESMDEKKSDTRSSVI